MIIKSNVAILLIGETFRSSYTREPCTLSSIKSQKQATTSYVKTLSKNNNVSFFYTMSIMGHTFLRNFNSSDYDFLFPDCNKFKSELACDHLSLYRPPDMKKNKRSK